MFMFLAVAIALIFASGLVLAKIEFEVNRDSKRAASIFIASIAAVILGGIGLKILSFLLSQLSQS